LPLFSSFLPHFFIATLSGLVEIFCQISLPALTYRQQKENAFPVIVIKINILGIAPTSD
jgi:hypothetical protein